MPVSGLCQFPDFLFSYTLHNLHNYTPFFQVSFSAEFQGGMNSANTFSRHTALRGRCLPPLLGVGVVSPIYHRCGGMSSYGAASTCAHGRMGLSACHAILSKPIPARISYACSLAVTATQHNTTQVLIIISVQSCYFWILVPPSIR